MVLAAVKSVISLAGRSYRLFRGLLLHFGSLVRQEVGQKVLTASNSWLHAQTRQSRYCYDKDRGYVCTLSIMVIKSNTAHIFHVGDSRIYRLHGHDLEQLTEDHRLWVSQEKSYLSRAMGMDSHLEIDHQPLA